MHLGNHFGGGATFHFGGRATLQNPDDLRRLHLFLCSAIASNEVKPLIFEQFGDQSKSTKSTPFSLGPTIFAGKEIFEGEKTESM